jgi:hypothetical protein
MIRGALILMVLVAPAWADDDLYQSMIDHVTPPTAESLAAERAQYGPPPPMPPPPYGPPPYYGPGGEPGYREHMRRPFYGQPGPEYYPGGPPWREGPPPPPPPGPPPY